MNVRRSKRRYSIGCRAVPTGFGLRRAFENAFHESCPQVTDVRVVSAIVFVAVVLGKVRAWYAAGDIRERARFFKESRKMRLIHGDSSEWSGRQLANRSVRRSLTFRQRVADEATQRTLQRTRHNRYAGRITRCRELLSPPITAEFAKQFPGFTAIGTSGHLVCRIGLRDCARGLVSPRQRNHAR